MIHLIEAERIEPNRWRNGAGLARTLLQWPSAEAFKVHVALADITQDSPFSHYPGMQRWFQSISPHPVALVHATRRLLLDVHSAPHEFEGGDAPAAQLQAGAVRDVSFMGPAAQGQLLMRAVAENEPVTRSDAWRGVFTLHAAVLQAPGHEPMHLPALSLAWSADAGMGTWQLQATAQPLQAWAMHWQPIA